ncbi:MAG: heat-inducible transcriptional repressor HrcA [Thermacetogeniaceae bacterium]
MQLNQRKQQVLEAVVEDHIISAEPVSSRTIARKYQLGVSPATIRNEMADLEEMGLIEQPHTSSGRIPSQQGYRYYVDRLMRRSELTEDEEGQIHTVFARQAHELALTVQHTIKLVSRLTDYLVFFSGPQLEQSALQQVQLIALAPKRALMVIVSETGWVESKFVDFSFPVSGEDLEQVAGVLNEHFRGLTFSQITRTVLNSIYQELTRQRLLVDYVLEVMESLHTGERSEGLYLGSTRNVLKQPEYQDIQQVRKLLELVESEQTLREILSEANHEGITVRIGKENRQDQVQDCGVITAVYMLGGNIVGAMGLLGPVRMNYARASTVVECITQSLSEFLSGSGNCF